ncbi:MAG: hypothetical protein A3H57_00955 [Candidatus Taylorbacteria bacterium RIFCSPLOWO2_02_FULL_43_11]|uniref:NTP pyrophosphohydrolase MazG-like domain-containing protein n=1 Tax=Candidatus Taylorbacteria bacterium RIFCSPHIGHO2_02_FULL_43_32b TaxID=1802306 RepID=A0A1G2MLU5_9BACT|nr:MAG: hypothetical protein A2743_03995 [Candidatus Taylorbacteria bacterium RIFCSPHIGHO2_01_FULL_43_47]OHA24001.1 MAG: hypothetical protein A3C72_02555 [Candidatus Taylorbacteria bacterium RIFCSPHIGHO2_02_FULL_43_32b]OHA31019.1 MAG: hypothetical protein A3B08_03065 [Candidatus Taylorbacteria bacterium RIFCSPLOWO2_01_FULL_43_44]OHA37702.1 MAG: hypothetical protein A3H57_00955 [Candidatus Taylorbacteria bacterium RIFCSPLOWO2_02_FULL_43_11]
MYSKEFKEFIDMQDGRLKTSIENYPDNEKAVFARMIKLTEEVGELADEVLAESSFQRQDKLAKREKGSLEAEFADVVITVFLLAKSLNLDIDKSLREKIAKINKRYEK